MRTTTFALALATIIVVPALAEAQQTPPRRRQQAIEIRGQVPTPQVVTVRPREVPAYSRQVLVPNFYDHDFWPAILPGYQLVSRRQITGMPPVDSASIRRNQAMVDSLRVRIAPDTVRRGAPARMTPPVVAPDTTRGSTPPGLARQQSGTASASTAR